MATGPIHLPSHDAISLGPQSPPSALSPPPPGSSGKSTNPLSSKVTTVLSTSYVDAEFRESLTLLDERGIRNTAEARRQLRLDVQKEVIESNGEIITEFGRVAEQLRRIGTTIDKLNKSYQEMKSHVTAAHDATSSTIQEASSLMTQRQNVETKQQLLKAFREHFVLTEDEVASLTMTAEPVDDQFFLVLSKAKRIRDDCEILLGFENQTLGLEIMDQTSKNLNQAFQKLYRWVQKEFKTLNLENPQIHSSVRRALRVLAERPSLFQNCLDFFAEAREQILSDSFYLALTGTSASGVKDHSVKPIELVAHDPLRYVGDMLAWAHSATVSEREALEVLFVSDGNEIAKGIQEGRENELWRLMADEDDGPVEFNAVKALNDLVDRDVSGAARILRQRIEQVIQTNEETILAYKLANLLGFYRFTFSKLLGDESVLLQSMANVESEALRQFRSLMRDHIATLQGEFQHTPSDLGPPDFLQDALKQLTAIMKTYETSIAASSPSADRAADFEPILAESFDPFLSGCENMSQTLSPGTSGTGTDTDTCTTADPTRSIFLINCLLAARHALSPFDFASARVARLTSRIDELAALLVDAQYAFFRRSSSLEPLFDALAPLRRGGPQEGESEKEKEKEKEEVAARIASGGVEAARPEALARASQGLDDFLPSAVMDAVDNVGHLQDARLARAVTEEAADRFCAEFELVEEMLVLADEMAAAAQPKGEEGAGEDGEDGKQGGIPESGSLRALFPRTTGEIRVLLS